MDRQSAPKPPQRFRLQILLRSAIGITLLAVSSCSPTENRFYNPSRPQILATTKSCTSEASGPMTCVDVSGTTRLNLYGPPNGDHFIDMTEFCDLRDGAPISDKCIGFVGGIVEVKAWKDLDAREESWAHYGSGSCIPLRKLTVAEIFQQIRPWLRKNSFSCGGDCPSASYIEAALNAVFPCK